MNHVLTVKIPYLLLDRLEERSSAAGQSKGAVVREALESFLGRTKKTLPEPNQGDLIRKATRAFLKGRKILVEADWEAIRRKASQNPASSAAEEVLKFRRRHL